MSDDDAIVPAPPASTREPQRASDVDAGEIVLLRNGAEAFPAWLEAIRGAQREVLLEMYWFESDATGRRFADALIERARAGLDVFVLYDSVGCFGADPAMFAAMEAAGAHVIEYHPIAPWRKRFRLDRVTRRDHRKLLVCDAAVGFTGGINICDQEAPREQGGGGWRDDAVRLTGPAVAELRALFFDTWLPLGGPAPRRGAAVERRVRREVAEAARAQTGAPERARLRALSERIGVTTRTSHPTFAELARSRPTAVERAAPRIQVIGHTGWSASRSIRNMYVRQMRAAKTRILIANSYFLPDIAVRRALERAARRGVEVRVIVPAQSDLPSVQYACRALYARLMRAGIHVHEWVDSMLHSKTALIDQWATVGSYNLDYRSLLYNRELNAASRDVQFVASVEASLRADLARCREVDPATWPQRPWTQKALEWFYWALRKIL